MRSEFACKNAGDFLDMRVLGSGELVKAFTTIFDDEKLDLGNKLHLEAICYISGLF